MLAHAHRTAHRKQPSPITAGTAKKMSAAAADEYPRRPEQAFGADANMAGQRSTLVLASYPVLLLLIILSIFVKYLWIALVMYCALLLLLSFVSAPTFSDQPAAARCSRGGLSAAAIAAVAPAFHCDAAAAGESEVAQCAVCLEAARGGEKVRRLPACAHMFHVGCIDMWLDSHATCPVCRCHVVPHKGCKESSEPPVPQLAVALLPPV
jgi:hypothetical protein